MPVTPKTTGLCIIGAGCTPFAEHFDKSYERLLAEAVHEALDDAGLVIQDIGAGWLGTAFPDAGVYKGRSGMDLAEAVALFDVPITRVSNYCATGGDALRNGMAAVASGTCKYALIAGVEKLRDRPPQDSIVKMMVEAGNPYLQKGFTAAGTFAIYASRWRDMYGMTREDLADVSVKNHKHAITNPKAHYRKAVTREQVLKSPMVADPLTTLDSCPTTDGAAAVIVCKASDVPAGAHAIKIAGQGLSVSTGWDLPFFDNRTDFLSFRATRVAAAEAYRQAGIDDPRSQIQFAEVHDCFSIVELLTYADLGFCDDGEGLSFLRSGAPCVGGKLPVNVSGGLLSCGHPIGATGLRMVYEICRQLQRRREKGQLPGEPDVGLAHNIGGPGAVASVTVLSN
jgi:acetyl-CoA C-acetyltransferase